jgi:hypothetical protein
VSYKVASVLVKGADSFVCGGVLALQLLLGICDDTEECHAVSAAVYLVEFRSRHLEYRILGNSAVGEQLLKALDSVKLSGVTIYKFVDGNAFCLFDLSYVRLFSERKIYDRLDYVKARDLFDHEEFDAAARSCAEFNDVDLLSVGDELYEQGIIDSSFSGGFETVDGCALLTCGGDSYEAETVLSAILDCARRLLEIGIPDADLLRMKRSALGRRIRDLDSFDSTCFRLCAYKMADFDYFCFPAVYTEVTAQQVLAFIEKVVKKERCALSVIQPRK